MKIKGETLCLVVILSLTSCRTEASFAFTHQVPTSFLSSGTNSIQSAVQRSRRDTLHTFRLNAVEAKEETDEKDSEGLSDLDARVLQSLLDDSSLDLKSEENLKKMLETGRKPPSKKKAQPKKESEFSSTFFQTLTDNELWNSFTVKAETFVESAKIFVVNRIERDAQLLASVGLFAWQRALKDVGRALPSQGQSGAAMAKKMRDSLFLLTNNSSFVEYIPEDNFILPPSKYSEGVETGIREELNTPMDEIKSVTEAIKDILSGKTVVTQDRGLRSVAPAGTARNSDRIKKAYERRKETTLKREKEGIDKKVLRATSSVTDAAWELKREMDVEGNTAGYRAKNAQRQLEGTLESVGLLKGESGKTFRGIGERLFGVSKKRTETKQLESAAAVEAVMEEFLYDDIKVLVDELEQLESIQDDYIAPYKALNIEDLNAERRRVIATLTDCLNNPGQTWLKPGTKVASPESEKPTEKEPNDVDLPFFVNGDASNVTETEAKKEDKEEKAILPEINSMNQDTWETLITTMVLTRNDIDAEMSDESETFQSEEEIYAVLRGLESKLNLIVSLAAASAGEDASLSIRMELFELDENNNSRSLLYSVNDIIDERATEKANIEAAIEAQNIAREKRQIQIEERKKKIEDRQKQIEERMKEIEAQKLAEEEERRQKEEEQLRFAREREEIEAIRSSTGDAIGAEVVIDDDEIATPVIIDNGADESYRDVVVTEVISSDAPTSFSVKKEKSHEYEYVEFDVVSNTNQGTMKSGQESNENEFFEGEYANVEIVTDVDEDMFSKEPKTMNSAAFQDEEKKEVETPIAVKLALRTLDIAIFITEKTFTVGIPFIFNAYGLAKERTEEVKRDGMGKDGWEDLANLSDPSKRY